jgi:hypothetical protein
VVVCGGHKVVFCQISVTDSSPLVPEVYIEIYLDRTSETSHPTNKKEEQPNGSKDELQAACG